MGAWDSGETIETHGKQGVTFSQPRQPFASQLSKGINFKRKLVRPFGVIPPIQIPSYFQGASKGGFADQE